MKPLGRNQVDALVREVEDDGYGLALSLTLSRQIAEVILLDAFADEARAFAASQTLPDLTERLRLGIRSRAERRNASGRLFFVPAFRRRRASTNETPPLRVAVPPELHARLVDRVEEHQFVESTARRKAVLFAILGLIAVVAVVAVLWVRLDALGTARPRITNAVPHAGAVDVPIRGDFSVEFEHPPLGRPRLTLEPAQGTLGAVAWDGSVLLVNYADLHYATHYQVILDVDYQSRFKDRGHWQQRWSFTTEHYPVLLETSPANGATVVPRDGVLTVAFDHQPLVDPRVTFQPANGSMRPGWWNGTTWTVSYVDLKPSTAYRATVAVDYGVASANLTRSWTFTTEPGMPPPGVPVLWHSQNDPGNQGNQVRMLALDWNGNLVGTMYQPVTLQSPDGSIVGTASGTYLDRSGSPLSELNGIPFYPVIADDDRHVCVLSSSVGARTTDEFWLMTGPIAGPLRAVAPVGSPGARSALALIACSVTNDRAVIVYSGMGGPTAVRVIALSTGRVLYQQSYALAVWNVVSSRDGRYLAEEMPVASSNGYPSNTVIRRTSDGAIVARLASQLVVRFSWDDERAVITNPTQSGGSTVVSLVAWRSARVLWTISTAEAEPVTAWTEPNGGKMAIAMSSRAAWPFDRLWFVDADGQASLVLSEEFYPASVTGS